MSACPIVYPWGNAPTYNFLKPVLTGDLLEQLNKSFITTEKVNSIRTTLSEEIDKVYSERNYDGWANSKKEKSYAIKYFSTEQAKEFASYIENIKQPQVIPFMDGFIGFEWNFSNKIISIVFKDNGNYIYSISTDSINVYGENKQNTENQLDLSNRIFKILSEDIV